MFTPKSEIQQAFTWSHAVTYIAIPFNCPCILLP